MTMRANALITADASQAKAETQSLKKETDAVIVSTKKIGTESKKTARSGGIFNRALSATGSRLSLVRTRIATYVAGLRKVDETQKLAGGSVANLTSQFNDIGVMMAAGQSPFQLAIQQGTQITQVLGNQGAASAARALGSAFVSMVSPLNLITIGSIAAGAAAVQWLTGAGEKAETLEDRIESLKTATDDYRDSVTRSYSDLAKTYGAVTDQVLNLQRETRLLHEEDLKRQADQVGNLVVGSAREHSKNLNNAMMDLFGPDQDDMIQTTDHITALADQLDALSNAKGIDTQLALIDQLKSGVRHAAGGFREMNADQLAFYQTLRDAEDVLRASQGAMAAQWAEIKSTADSFGTSFKDYLDDRLKEHSAGQSMLTELREQAALQDAINRHGADSAQVADLRAAAERRVLDEKLAALPVSEDLKDEIRAALEHAQALAQTDIAGTLSAAAIEARRVADEIVRAVDASNQLSVSGAASLEDSKVRVELADDPIKMAGQLARNRMRRTQGTRRDGAEGGELAALDAEVEAYGRLNEQIATNNKARTDRLKSTRNSGGGSASDVRAADRLIASLRQELALMREIDPVQKELARNKALLDKATDDQRQTIEALIEARMREQKAAQATNDLTELVGRNTNSVLDAMSQKGAKAADVFTSLAVSVAKAFAQARLLGTGPLAGVLGTAGGGGWIGSLFGQQAAQSSIAALPAFADGGDLQLGGRASGLLDGVGGPRQDNILFWGSKDEFIQPAASVDYYGRDFMEALRQRKLPRFANGGPLGGTAGASARLAGSHQTPGLTMVFNDYSSQGVTPEVTETRDADGNRRIEMALSDKVGTALVQPGGGAQKTLRSTYGLQKRGTLR